MKKLNRKISSLNFFFRKTYRRLSVSKPPYYIIALALAGASIFLLGGGIYDILVKPSPYGVLGGEIIFFYPQSLQQQLLGGSVIVMVLYALGALGLWMVYRSTRYAHNPRHSAILLFVGMALMVLAFALVESIIYNYKVYFGRR
ncbi:MAG: hypothetical protein ACE5NN_06645 [Candidatus Bathyarchaeia archaeon]